MIVLASASPRRHALLRDAGLRFVVRPSATDETLEADWGPVEAAVELARRKALAVAPSRGEDDWVLGADTIVAVPDDTGVERLLGKPADEAEAARMLARLSGRRHRVVTGIALAQGALLRGSEGTVLTDSETTWVRMRRIESHEVEAYVASGEWRGKAGGYAIQETADRFVEGLEEGGFDNVVGLPVARVLRLLASVGAR